MSLASKKQGKPSSSRKTCGTCSTMVALAASLPKASLSGKPQSVEESNFSRVTSWECCACGANYITLTTMSSIRVKEKPTIPMMHSARLECMRGARIMREMLCAIFLPSLLSEQEQNILREKNDTDS